MIDRSSLQFRLAWRLGLVLIVACTLVVAGFAYFAGNTNQQLASQSLDCIMLHFLADIGWTFPIIVTLAMAIGIIAIRQGLRPLTELSADIGRMTPGNQPSLLGATRLPSEVVPLVKTLNATFQRLHDGYEAQRRFTSNAAHELRTPLAVLRSDVDALSGRDAAKLGDDVERMTRVVAQLLALARAEAGDLGTIAQSDLAQIVTMVAGTIAPLAHAKSVSLAFDGPPDGVLIQASIGTIETLTRNLIENAVAHTASGSEVLISVDSSGRLTVDDQGPGIPYQFRDRIFERFWRGDWSPAGGTGLGLSIVKEIAQRVGAKIAVAESPAGGARFTVAFPAVDA